MFINKRKRSFIKWIKNLIFDLSNNLDFRVKTFVFVFGIVWISNLLILLTLFQYFPSIWVIIYTITSKTFWLVITAKMLIRMRERMRKLKISKNSLPEISLLLAQLRLQLKEDELSSDERLAIANDIQILEDILQK